MKTRILLLLLAVPIIFSFTTGNENAYDIVKKMDDKLKGKTTEAEIKIEIIRPKWQRELTMSVWTKGANYSMIYINSPVKEKGTAFLKRNKEVWNWVPSIEKIIKLPPSMMSQAWMGTDFTNDDLVKHNSLLEDYVHEMKGEVTIDDRLCYKISMTPKPDAAVVWGKIITYIDKKDFIQMKAEFYDEDETLINVMVGKDIKLLGGKLLASRIEMTPMDKKQQKTVLTYNSLVFDKEIADNFFSPDKMKSLK